MRKGYADMPRQLAKIIADSISPDGVRLTTMEVVMPRIVLAEINTHRQFSRSSASSRAIPIEKMLARVMQDPYIPEEWGQNGKGMQAHGTVSDDVAEVALHHWLTARDHAVDQAERLAALGIHKQTTNRLLEPFMWHTVIVTATEWSNFYNLRCNPLAHPALRNTAEAMRDAQAASTPNPIAYGEWHLPFFPERDADISPSDRVKVCAARCARVSYLTHDGVRDPNKDIELADSLLANGHMAPLEHVARPLAKTWEDSDLLNGMHPGDIEPKYQFIGNFRGWVQFRKTIANEADVLAHRSSP
jgi:thymidylate synthase ThyX